MASHWPPAVISLSLSRAWIQSPTWARLPSLSPTRSTPGRHPAAFRALAMCSAARRFSSVTSASDWAIITASRPAAHGGGPVQHHVPPGLVLTPGVDAAPCLVVRDHGDVTLPELERGVFLPLLGEPVHLVDFHRAEPVGQQREHAARVDRAELVFIAHRHDPGPGLVGCGLQFEQVGGVDLPGLVDQDYVTGADLDRVDGGPAGGFAEEPGQVIAERGRPGRFHFPGRDPGGVLRHGDRVHQAAGQLRPCLSERPGQPGLAGPRRRPHQRHGLCPKSAARAALRPGPR